MRIEVGQVVAKKYKLVRFLGRGSAGEVWVAHHTTLREDVALKLLTRAPETEHVESRATAAARFLFEAQVAARLSRKTRHIVRVTDHGEDDGLAYIVMELLEGETLEQRRLRESPLPVQIIRKVIAQIARALAQAHAEKVIHRDLKPANVFVTRDEDGGLLVKLLDFGIARAIHTHRVSSAVTTGRDVVFGTPGYMSPEQARASSKLDHQCDLWALSTIAYELWTGELPVPGADVDELLKNLCAGRVASLRKPEPPFPIPVAAFFDRAFADNVEDRYASVEDLLSAFERAADAKADQASTPPRPAAVGASQAMTAPPRTGSKPRPAQTRLALMGSAVLLVTAAVGVAWRLLAGSAGAATAAASHVRTPATLPEPADTSRAERAAAEGKQAPMPSATLQDLPGAAEKVAPPVSSVPGARNPADRADQGLALAASAVPAPSGSNERRWEGAHPGTLVVPARAAGSTQRTATPADSAPLAASAAARNRTTPVDRSEVF